MNDKMRKEFEAAFVAQFGFGRMAASSNPDASGMLACAEWAWFASRESLVIELPKPWQTNVGAMMTPNGVKFAIGSAGLKYMVKP